jgi:hypothetical protein
MADDPWAAIGAEDDASERRAARTVRTVGPGGEAA